MAKTRFSAKKKDIDTFLKDNNLTRVDMQKIYEECIEINHKVRALSKLYAWYELPINIIMQLPTCKENTLKVIAEKELVEKKEQEERKQREKEKEYYEDNFETIMYHKIINGEPLTEKEIARITFVYEVEERPLSAPDRWTTPWETIVELRGKRFSIKWNRANTEYQENNFFGSKFVPC